MPVRVEISKRLVFINAASAALQQALSLTILVWLQQYLVRRVSADEFAIYGVIIVLMRFVPLVSIVVGAGLARSVTEAYALGDERRVTQIVSTMFPLSVLVSLAILVGGETLAWNIPYVLTVAPEMVSDARLMFGILVFVAAMRLACIPFSAGLQIRQKFVWLHIIEFSSELLSAAILLVLLFTVSNRVLWVIVAGLPSTLLALAVTVVISRRLVPALTVRTREFRWELIRPITALGFWTMLRHVAVTVREICGPLLLNKFSTSFAVNSYQLGAQVENRLFPGILRPLVTVQPAMIGMHATGQVERLRGSFLRLSRFTLWLFLSIAVPLIVYRDDLWLLYLGAEKHALYGDAALIMTILLVKAVFSSAQPVIAQLALAQDRMGSLAARIVAIETVTVLLMLYFVIVLDMGAMGVALATCSVHAIGQPLLNWPFALSMTGTSMETWLRKTLLPGILPAAAATSVCLAARYLDVPDNWLELGAHAALSLAVFGGVLAAFCLDEEDRADLRTVMRSARALLTGRRAP